MGSYKLGQETKITSYKSHQVQWVSMQQVGGSITNTLSILQFSSKQTN